MRPQQALEVIQAGLLIDPLAADLHSSLGGIYRDLQQLDLAREAFQRSQQLAPDNPNIYSDLALLELESNNLPVALKWRRKATEVDPQDHELAAEIAELLYDLELPEEGDRWFARVKALVPDSPAQHQLEIERAVARKEYDRAIALAEKVIAAQVEDRRGAFSIPLFTYRLLMLNSGRAKEAYDFLVSVRPEITDYSTLPDGLQGTLMQYASVILMSGFEDFETRKQAILQMTANFDAKGFPWRDPKRSTLLTSNLLIGDTQAAIDNFLNVRLNLPMASNPNRHKRRDKVLFAPVYDDPAVATRLTQLDQEFTELREQVSEMVREAEWNQ